MPRFTIRTALAVVTGCAFIFLIAGMAYRGQAWAWGVTIAIASLMIAALVHAAWFGIVWLFAQLPSGREAAQQVVVATPVRSEPPDARHDLSGEGDAAPRISGRSL